MQRGGGIQCFFLDQIFSQVGDFDACAVSPTRILNKSRSVDACAVMQLLIKVLSKLDEIFAYLIRGEVGRKWPHFFMDTQRGGGIQLLFFSWILSQIGDFGPCAVFRPLNRIPSPTDKTVDHRILRVFGREGLGFFGKVQRRGGIHLLIFGQTLSQCPEILGCLILRGVQQEGLNRLDRLSDSLVEVHKAEVADVGPHA